MVEQDWYKHKQFLIDAIKQLSEADAANALREAWYKVYGEYPSDKSLAVLWAKSALETGRWKIIHCYNFGNIKKIGTHSGTDDGHYFTMYRCSEILNGKEMWFDPPHFQTHFRAYKTAADGAEDYIRFVSQKKRYAKAWQKVIAGDPKGYSHELAVAGYYTASESLYTKGVVRLFDEFMSKKDKLLIKHEQDDIDTIPSPPPSEPVVIPPLPPLPTINVQENIDTNVENEVPKHEVISAKSVPDVENKSAGTNGMVMMFMVAIVGAIAWVSQFFQGCQ